METPAFWIITGQPERAERWRAAIEAEGWSAAVALDLAGLDRLAASRDGRRRRAPAGVVLDWRLASARPASSIKSLRSRFRKLAVLVFAEPEQLYGPGLASAIESGASDFIPAAIGARELVARLKSHLGARRSPLGLLKAPGGELMVDKARRMAWTRPRARRPSRPSRSRAVPQKPGWEEAGPLTAKEFDLLCFLLENRASRLERRRLLAAVWGDKAASVNVETLDRHVGSLRRKLGACGKRIRTIHGFGYAFS